MPDEPNRRIEEELKAYAEQRRAEAGPPFELHPVNRRLLQDEVTRTFGLGESGSRTERSWLKLLWPRLALAGAVCLVGAFVVLQFLPPKTRSEYEMARGSVPAEAAPTSSPAPSPLTPVAAPAPEARPEGGHAERMLAGARNDLQAEPKARSADVGATAELAKEKDTTPAAAPSASAASAPADSSRSLMMQRRYGLMPAPGREPARPRTASEPAPALRPEAASAAETRQPMVMAEEAPLPAATRGSVLTESVALAARPSPTQLTPAASLAQPAGRGLETNASTLAFADLNKEQAGQRFVQVETRRRNFNSPLPPRVLRSFQLRQSGPQVEIVDEDGSIYRGAFRKAESEPDKLVTTPPAAALDRPTQADSVAALAPERPLSEAKAPAISSLQFYVIGTNLSLNERVAFEGRMVTGTNAFGVGYVAGGQAARPAVRTSAPTTGAAPAAAPRQLLPLLRIQGQATVGERTKLEINAAPASR